MSILNRRLNQEGISMIEYNRGDGSSKENAIVILAENEFEGVDSEYLWLEEKYGEQDINWELMDQEFIDEGHRQYHILRIKFLSGETKEFYFDITKFYDKE